MSSSKLRCAVSFRTHLLLDFLDMVELVSERRVHISEAQRRDVGYDFVRGLPLVLVPLDNVQHSNAVACDARSAAAYILSPDNSLGH